MAETQELSKRAKARQKRANNLDIQILRNGALTYERFQTLPLSAFNRAGLPDVCYIMKLSEHDRLQPFLFDADSADVARVIGAASWDIRPEFYKQAKMVFPMTCEFKLGPIGKTSIVTFYTYYNSATGEIIAKGMKVNVFISTTTQRATSVPESFVHKYASFSNKESFVTSLQSKAQHSVDVYEYHLRVRASDEDFLYHTNQVSYVRFALDAAADASMAGKLHNFPGDIAEYEVAKVDVAHKAQSFAGDNLLVYIWEDKDDNLVINTQINREDIIIAFCKLQFRPPTVNSNL